MKILELFSGTASFSQVAEKRGHECRTLDFDARFNPTYCMSVMDFSPEILFDEATLTYWKPDVVWASPPCQCFSVMVIRKNWTKNADGTYTPKRSQTVEAMRIVERMLDIIKELNPVCYFVENPRAMLRKMPFMQGLPRTTVTYCQYGMPYQKATDIWTNCEAWKPKPACSPRSPCMTRAPRGSRYGVQGIRADGRLVNSLHPQMATGEAKGQENLTKHYRRSSLHPSDLGDHRGWNATTLRSIVPPALCEEILIACEKKEE